MKEHITPWREMPVGTIGTLVGSFCEDAVILGAYEGRFCFKISGVQKSLLYPHSTCQQDSNGFTIAYIDVEGEINGFTTAWTPMVKWFSHE